MDTQPTAPATETIHATEQELEFEIEDVNEIDIFAPGISLCSSTCSSACA